MELTDRLSEALGDRYRTICLPLVHRQDQSFGLRLAEHLAERRVTIRVTPPRTSQA